MTSEQKQQRAQMEEAVTEMRQLIAQFERGALEQEAPEEMEKNLRRILRDREAWLRGEVILSALAAKEGRETDVGQIVDGKLKSVVEGAQMFTQIEAIKHLRSLGDMNHSPLRKIEREWLDRIFIRDRISKDWLGLASVIATTEEMGCHVENNLRVPCKCPDSVNRKPAPGG